MRRIVSVLVVAALMAATLGASTLPAMAASPAGSVVFYPYGNGITYSCAGGPPFVVGPGSPEANCALWQIGPPPAGLVCDVPTAITFVHDMHQEVYEGKLCRGSDDGARPT
jgi:hypothetical protein